MEALTAFLSTYNTTQLLSAFVVLFAIIDIIGVLPVVLNLFPRNLTRNGKKQDVLQPFNDKMFVMINIFM